MKLNPNILFFHSFHLNLARVAQNPSNRVSTGKERPQACAESGIFPTLQHARSLGVGNHSNRSRKFGLLQSHRKLRHAHGKADARGTPQYVLAAFGEAEESRSPAGEDNASTKHIEHSGMAEVVPQKLH
jgi:hypothetical protein